MPVRLAVSLGDPAGIGPEVTAHALARLGRRAIPYVFGDEAVLAPWLRRYRLALPFVDAGAPLPARGAVIRVTRLRDGEVRAGRPGPAGAKAQTAFLEAAYAAVAAGACDALCTAPVSKAEVAKVVPGFVGHTEWLEARSPGSKSVMMLAGSKLRVALVTNHLALSAVPRTVTPALILATVSVTHRALRDEFGIPKPRIAVCAMNPHAGDAGAFGDEEERIVAPALAAARRARIGASGPWPADSVMFRAVAGEFDAVVALYHDQGLIPVKLLDALGDPAVNVTLGLPIVRTSPDHGVAYDKAGQGVASPDSMLAALRMAADMAERRRRAPARGARRGPRSTGRF
ncbi:MAG TPA: 4-hydroxythreonine-4-phosphate dehydrogenase PdxA [Anaeromyxobacteraceae bacterium]|nr:4-hydroxythreonine-4-phosphate dehydrogenase PdxA [Anaeromyxobacteraceae bacterium]